MLLVLLEIVVGSAGDAPKLLLAVWELEHEVSGGLRVEGQFVLRVDVFADAFTGQTDGNEPVGAGIDPFAVEGLPVGAWRDKVFNLHLFKLT